MGHEHGHKPKPTCVADQGDQLALWPKGHLAIGELDVAPFPEPGADPSKLPLHLVKGGGRHRVHDTPPAWTVRAVRRLAVSAALRGFFVAFGYSRDAEQECAAFHKRTGRIIKLLTVQEILDEEHVQKM